ncbi:Actin- protein 2/3 complex subunit 3 [Boothiomyces macroporosus]|uniref:Actin-related protein 2/3 complex subunit 3 n=1 Tax=Boothiomyces macroporosus TaxID=261099 RepID=A0AAD5UDF0_9FUNG|nr:Actin- protein 2/3 complex subunit 3 [Boothiomyces macroporosus]KAJ3308546.1 Actin- protein 2/3 complex subunit 3 [Boothiomyces sp. JEL0838]
MPAYHSSFNQTDAKVISIPILPIKTKARQFAPNQLEEGDDIIDEALGLFRANTFFRNFDIKGGADKLLIYLTLYIQECLNKLSKLPNAIEGNKILQTHAVQNFPLPGDATFPLNSMFEKPLTRQDAEFLKGYLTQLRQELGQRLIERIYEDDKPSKWWMCFSKRKFMGMAGVGTLQ